MEAPCPAGVTATSEQAATSRTPHPRYRMTEMAALAVQLGWYREASLRPYVWAGAFCFFGNPPASRFSSVPVFPAALCYRRWPVSHQLIDMTKGQRSGQFACFRQMSFPLAGVTAEVDITDFAARRQGRPFFRASSMPWYGRPTPFPSCAAASGRTAAWWNTTGVPLPTPP